MRITDKVIIIQYESKGEQGQIEMIITADQLRQTARRRIATLLPNAKIIDMVEGGQLELAPAVTPAERDAINSRSKK